MLKQFKVKNFYKETDQSSYPVDDSAAKKKLTDEIKKLIPNNMRECYEQGLNGGKPKEEGEKRKSD